VNEDFLETLLGDDQEEMDMFSEASSNFGQLNARGKRNEYLKSRK